MNEVRTYLEKGTVDFNTGFALLKKYCDNEGIISLVEKRRNLQYLTFELKRLARRPYLKPVHGYIDLSRQLPDDSSSLSPIDSLIEKKNGNENGNEDEDDVVDWHRLKHYQNTKYEDMPNDICRKIYKDNLDLYKQLQHSHQQMKLANSDEGRASFRQEIINLDAAITNNWRLIDEEISSLSGKEDNTIADVKESTLRSRITRALKKETLSNEEFVELRDNYAIALQKELKFSEETLAKLKELGVID